MKAAIISNGSIENYDHCKEKLQQINYIICADGGTRHAFHMNIIPDIIIGDLDSSNCEYINYFISKGVPIKKYNADKDKTDTQICLEYAIMLYDEVLLLGATGRRLDHTLGNISILKLAADKGRAACIIDENNELYLVKDRISLKGQKGDLLSLLPLSSRVEGINLKGVIYPLQDAFMELGNPYGISNVFKENVIELSIASGYMLVIKSKD